MSNSIEVKNLHSMTKNILAPGATKFTTKIRLIKSDEDVMVIVEADPIVASELEEADLKVSHQFTVDKIYDTRGTKAKVKNGIITITIPVNTDVVQTINID